MFDSITSATLRSRDETDAEFLMKLYATMHEAAFLAMLPEPMHSQMLRMQYNTREQMFPKGQDWIIMKEGQRIGRILTYASQDELRLVDIAILPNCRGQGIGSELFKALKQHCGQTGRVLTLSVLAANTQAQRFYMRHGCASRFNDGAHISMAYTPR